MIRLVLKWNYSWGVALNNQVHVIQKLRVQAGGQLQCRHYKNSWFPGSGTCMRNNESSQKIVPGLAWRCKKLHMGMQSSFWVIKPDSVTNYSCYGETRNKPLKRIIVNQGNFVKLGEGPQWYACVIIFLDLYIFQANNYNAYNL